MGCRNRDPRSALLRVVLDESGAPVLDPGRSRPGRGAWLHPGPECLDLAERRRALPRALRVAGPLGLAGLRVQVLHESGPAAQAVGTEHDPEEPTMEAG